MDNKSSSSSIILAILGFVVSYLLFWFSGGGSNSSLKGILYGAGWVSLLVFTITGIINGKKTHSSIGVVLNTVVLIGFSLLMLFGVFVGG